MRIRSIKTRIILWMGVCLFVTMSALTVYSVGIVKRQADEARRVAINDGEYRLVSSIQDVASAYQDDMDHALDAARTLGQALAVAGDRTAGGVALKRQDVIDMLASILLANEQFLGIYTDWEPNAFDGVDASFAGILPSDDKGRFMPWWARSGDEIQLQDDLGTYDEELQEEYYYLPMQTKKDVLLDPYVDEVDGEPVLMTSLVVPILLEQRFLGISGIDIALSHLQALVDESAAGLYDGAAQLGIISYGGVVAAHSGQPELAGTPAADVYENWPELQAHIDNRESLVRDGQGNLWVFAYFSPGQTQSPWTVLLTLPEARLTEQADAETASAYRSIWVMAAAGVALTLLAFGIVWRMAASIAGPVQHNAEVLHAVSQGDVSRDVPQAFRQLPDETGELARATQAMTESLRGIFAELTHGIRTLTGASDGLLGVARQTAEGASAVSASTDQAAAAVQEMSANTVSVAAGMEQAMGSLNSVATATEEMTATIGEIAGNSEKARSTTLEAARQADRITAAMKELGRSAQEIGKVTETITSISAQTNLLALNATIEAARAGAAGKGFAVVANEIKELAQQTAAATGEIKGQIASVQSSTAGAAADIEQIVGVIKEVSETVTSIATAIEEQSVVTRDIAGNIAQASLGVKDANRRVAQTADVSRSIADGVSGVSQTSNEMAAASQQVQASAQELSELAQQLERMLARFKIHGER